MRLETCCTDVALNASPEHARHGTPQVITTCTTTSDHHLHHCQHHQQYHCRRHQTAQPPQRHRRPASHGAHPRRRAAPSSDHPDPADPCPPRPCRLRAPAPGPLPAPSPRARLRPASKCSMGSMTCSSLARALSRARIEAIDGRRLWRWGLTAMQMPRGEGARQTRRDQTCRD